MIQLEEQPVHGLSAGGSPGVVQRDCTRERQVARDCPGRKGLALGGARKSDALAPRLDVKMDAPELR